MIAFLCFISFCSGIIAYCIGYDAGKREIVEFIDGQKKLRKAIHEERQELYKEMVPDHSGKVIMSTMN